MSGILWRVLAAYVFAFATLVVFSVVALAVVRELYPELTGPEVAYGLPGLLAGGVASSTAFVVTLLAVARPLDAERLRLRPGRETGLSLAAMVLGTLALGQTLDSAVALLGLADRGTMAAIRRALTGASGADLFGSVVVIGVLAGAAEEIFFRGHIQTALRGIWGPGRAVLATSAAFAALHVDLELIHTALAFGLGLWLGLVTERAGSALPAVVSHVVNNVLFTMLTALGLTVDAVWPNVAVGAGAAAVFAGCAVVVVRLPR